MIWHDMMRKKKQCILWEFESNLMAEDFSSGISLDEYLLKWGLSKNPELHTLSWIRRNPMLSRRKCLRWYRFYLCFGPTEASPPFIYSWSEYQPFFWSQYFMTFCFGATLAQCSIVFFPTEHKKKSYRRLIFHLSLLIHPFYYCWVLLQKTAREAEAAEVVEVMAGSKSQQTDKW